MKLFKINFNLPYLNTFHFPYPSTWLVRKDKIIQAGLFDIRLNPRLHEDNEILPRLFRQGGFALIPESLVEYRAETEETRTSKNKDLTFERLLHDQKYFFLLWNQFGNSRPENIRIFQRILVLFLRSQGISCMQYANGQKVGRKLFIRTLLLPPSRLFGLKLFLKSMSREFGWQADQLILVEKMIPYAIAFGYINNLMEQIKIHYPNYNPDWYVGNTAFYLAYPSMFNSFSTSFQVAPPSSSGFSGGGFSGGGGGGGGGGSW